MISNFKYISPIQNAYLKVVESENETGFKTKTDADTQDNNANQNPKPSQEEKREAQEILDHKKGNPYRMSDEERKLFYQDEIKRLGRIKKYYEQQSKYVNGQGYARYSVERAIENYRRKLDEMNGRTTNNVPQTVSSTMQ